MVVFYGVTFRKKLKAIKFQFKIYTFHHLSQRGKLNYKCFYGCRTSALTATENHRSRVFEIKC